MPETTTPDASRNAEVAGRLMEADAAYKRVLGLDGKVSPASEAIAAGLCLTLHGHLFKEAAETIRALANQERVR